MTLKFILHSISHLLQLGWSFSPCCFHSWAPTDIKTPIWKITNIWKRWQKMTKDVLGEVEKPWERQLPVIRLVSVVFQNHLASNEITDWNSIHPVLGAWKYCLYLQQKLFQECKGILWEAEEVQPVLFWFSVTKQKSRNLHFKKSLSTLGDFFFKVFYWSIVALQC